MAEYLALPAVGVVVRYPDLLIVLLLNFRHVYTYAHLGMWRSIRCSAVLEHADDAAPLPDCLIAQGWHPLPRFRCTYPAWT